MVIRKSSLAVQQSPMSLGFVEAFKLDHTFMDIRLPLNFSTSSIFFAATTDESLQKYLESYLRFRRRWYDITPDNNGEAPVGTLLGDYDLYCHTFKVLYRM